MANPTFNGFSFQDNTNWFTERVTFKGFAKRDAIRGKINRREGVKLLATEFGEKEITIEGTVIAASAAALQSQLDSMKNLATVEEGQLTIETNRVFTATVADMAIPDEHYNNAVAPFMVTFLCSKPFAEDVQQSPVQNVPSGTFTFSGQVNISGSLFNRPTLVYTPPSATGDTLIRRLDIYHVPTGQTITISGFNNSSQGGLQYQNAVTVNMDTFSALEGTTGINSSGAFPRWPTGVNNYTVTASGRQFPGGTLQVVYYPRWL